MKKYFEFEMKWWGVVLLVMAYMLIIGSYFEYIINREMNEIVQSIASVIALMYTAWQIKLIVNFINKSINTKEK
jgi:hypothetical protein